MAALSPGAVVIVTGTALPIEFFPRTSGAAWGTVSLRVNDGYIYEPPDEGQVWPRGDYAPMG